MNKSFCSGLASVPLRPPPRRRWRGCCAEKRASAYCRQPVTNGSIKAQKASKSKPVNARICRSSVIVFTSNIPKNTIWEQLYYVKFVIPSRLAHLTPFIKIISMSAALCALAQGDHAQTTIKAGTVQLGGSVSYYQAKSEVVDSLAQKAEDRVLSIGPAVGYFIANNLAAGLNLSYSLSKSGRNDSNSPSFYEQRGEYFSVGPFVRYYRMLTEQFGLTGMLDAGYGHSNSYSSHGSNNNGTAKDNGLTLGLTPDLVFFPIPKLGLEISFGGLNYHHSVSKSEVCLNLITCLTRLLCLSFMPILALA